VRLGPGRDSAERPRETRAARSVEIVGWIVIEKESSVALRDDVLRDNSGVSWECDGPPLPNPSRIGENVEDDQPLVLDWSRFAPERVQNHDKNGRDRRIRQPPYVERKKLALAAARRIEHDPAAERAEALGHEQLSQPARVGNLGEESGFVGVYFLLQSG
jgi:hypothetical protein